MPNRTDIANAVETTNGSTETNLSAGHQVWTDENTLGLSLLRAVIDHDVFIQISNQWLPRVDANVSHHTVWMKPEAAIALAREIHDAAVAAIQERERESSRVN